MSAAATETRRDTARTKRPRKAHIYFPWTDPYLLCGKLRRGPGFNTLPPGSVPCAECRSSYVRLTGRLP